MPKLAARLRFPNKREQNISGSHRCRGRQEIEGNGTDKEYVYYVDKAAESVRLRHREVYSVCTLLSI